MKTGINILLCLILMISCTYKEQEMEWISIKGSGSIEKYQNYLITYPKTVHLIEAIDSIKILWSKDSVINWDCYGNCMTLMLNDKNIIFHKDTIDKDSLPNQIKYSILNPNDLLYLPDKKVIEVDSLGEILVSKGVIDIISDTIISPDYYSEIITLVKSGFLMIRKDNAFAIFGKDYRQLDLTDRKIIDKIQPINIRFERPGAFPLKVPPPPPDSIKVEKILRLFDYDKK
jgi:hypothetical protein